jgi:hypothetical protein
MEISNFIVEGSIISVKLQVFNLKLKFTFEKII